MEVLASVNVVNQVQNLLGFFTVSALRSQSELKTPRDAIRWAEKTSEDVHDNPREVLI